MGMAEQESQWRQVADDAFSHLSQWRREHPRATFAEIEAATDAHLAAMRARVLRDVAVASAAVTQLTRCPACGAQMQTRGTETRTLVTAPGQPVPLTRARTVCPACGAGLFPPR